MRLIFHIPLKIDRNDPSASQIRPQKLMNAFTELGWEMDVVEGYARERKRQISIIKEKIRKGVHYDFCYSESSTMPTLLTEPHHLPTHPCLDFGFLAFCRRNGIPVGLFYRDIHWLYANKGDGLKQRVAYWFYRYDLMQYGKLLDTLFLPTLDMQKRIPYPFTCHVCELPAGYQSSTKSHTTEIEKNNEKLNLLYVGGVGGNYNLLPLIDAVANMTGVQLTLCCRSYDWKTIHNTDEPHLTPTVRVVHLGGKELEDAYMRADLFTMTMNTEYLRFAAPYKLFEAIGHRLPILAASGTWSGDMVERNKIGITCENEAGVIRNTLQTICNNRELLEQYKVNLDTVAEQNTWQARCRQIATALLKKEI